MVQGLSDMQRALRRAESGLGPELKKRLKDAGEQIVAPAARARAPRGLDHTGSLPRLATTIRSGANQRGASVWSTHPGGGVQNFGGRVGRNHATVLERNRVSQYMTEAVKATREPVAREVESVLDWLAQELERG